MMFFEIFVLQQRLNAWIDKNYPDVPEEGSPEALELENALHSKKSEKNKDSKKVFFCLLYRFVVLTVGVCSTRGLSWLP